MKMPVPHGCDKVLSSAMSWSLPKCLSAHVSLLLRIMLWLPSAPSIKTEPLTLALVLCRELDLAYLWLHLPALPPPPVTQPPETYCAQHLPRLFLSVPPPISLPTHDLCPSETSSSPPLLPSSPTALTLSRRALQAWPLVSARLGLALAPPPLRQTCHPPHATSPSTKKDHGGRGGGQPPAPGPPALSALPPLLGEPTGSGAQHALNVQGKSE